MQDFGNRQTANSCLSLIYATQQIRNCTSHRFTEKAGRNSEKPSQKKMLAKKYQEMDETEEITLSHQRVNI